MPNKTVKAGLGGPKNKAEAFIGSTIARVSSHIPRRPSAKAQCREPRRLDRSRHLGSDHCGSPSLPPLTTLVGLLTLPRAVAQKINAKHNEEGDDSSCNHGLKRGHHGEALALGIGRSDKRGRPCGLGGLELPIKRLSVGSSRGLLTLRENVLREIVVSAVISARWGRRHARYRLHRHCPRVSNLFKVCKTLRVPQL